MNPDLATSLRVKLLMAGIPEPEEIVTIVLKTCKEHYEPTREQKDAKIAAVRAMYEHEFMLSPEVRQEYIARETARINCEPYPPTFTEREHDRAVERDAAGKRRRGL